MDDQIVELLRPKTDLLKLVFSYFVDGSKSRLETLVCIKHDLLSEILPEDVEQLRTKYGHTGFYQARIETDQAMVFNAKIRAVVAKIDEQIRSFPQVPCAKV